MSRRLISTALLIGTLLVSGCSVVSERLAARREAAAAKRAAMPVAATVCVAFDGVDMQGAGVPFLRRKIASRLAEEGFRYAEGDCEAAVKYTAFNHGQWELIDRRLLGTKSRSAWRTEGVLELSHGARMVEQDRRVDIRDAKTMQDMLDELAGEITEIVTKHLRPASPETQSRPA